MVVGDIVKLETGMRVPADCILISGSDVAVDESDFTGEPELCEKEPLHEDNYQDGPMPFLLAKSLINSGRGTAIVCAVGVNTFTGQAECKLEIEDSPTPLQCKLEVIANEVGKAGVYVAILTFVAMTVNLIFTIAFSETRKFNEMRNLSSLVTYLIIGITIVVVAVPEGLPLAVTISLAYSVSKMKNENNLVRKLEASETMGGAHEILSDKTGTLTENKMTAMNAFTCGTIFEASSSSLKEMHSSADIQQCVLGNCNARLEKEKGEVVVLGNPTEVAIINFLIKNGVNAYEDVKKKNGNILQSIPFSSARKRQSTIMIHPKNSDMVRVISQGAPDFVLKQTTRTLDKNGNVVDYDDERAKETHDAINTFAKLALRTLLIGYNDMTRSEYDSLMAANNNFKTESDRKVLEENICMIAIFGIKDPIRKSVPQSVAICNRAGITVRMVTGDNLETAKAIAREAGILTDEDMKNEYSCMTGE